MDESNDRQGPDVLPQSGRLLKLQQAGGGAAVDVPELIEQVFRIPVLP